METFKLTIEYDGTDYAGWQRQADQPTIQAALEAALEQITQLPVPVIAAGRTDAGVHALGQVASFQSDKSLLPDEWTRALNGLLPPDIVIRSTECVTHDFHARYQAHSKLYEYRIRNRAERSALDRNRVWHIVKPLDVPSMREAATFLLGRHDYSSFQGSPTDTKDPICHLTRIQILQDDTDVRIEVQADRFLKQMVRAIVGTLVEVGQAKRAPSSLKAILEARDRSAAGKTAPPHGLYLVTVFYS